MAKTWDDLHDNDTSPLSAWTHEIRGQDVEAVSIEVFLMTCMIKTLALYHITHGSHGRYVGVVSVEMRGGDLHDKNTSTLAAVTYGFHGQDVKAVSIEV